MKTKLVFAGAGVLLEADAHGQAKILLLLLVVVDMDTSFSNAESTSVQRQGRNNFWKPSKPCHVGIHWIPLTEYSQMSTHLKGFQ